MDGIKQVFEFYLGETETRKFALWAFGKWFLDFESLYEFASVWNRRHKGKYKIKTSHIRADDFRKMIEIWRKYGA